MLTGAQRGIVERWPAGPRAAAYLMASKYGPADEAVDSRLIWRDAGCWRELTVLRDPVAHYWPTPHEDFIETKVLYKIDPAIYSAMAEFDGSVSLDRTRGTLTALGGGEEENFVATNLANSIVLGVLDAYEAKAMAEDVLQKLTNGIRHPWTEALQFTPPEGYPGDPDTPAF